MDKCIFDESNGLWSQRHKQYLKENRHIVYTTMRIEGTLHRYLADINQQAEQMFHRLIEEMAQKAGCDRTVKRRTAYGMDRIDK